MHRCSSPPLTNTAKGMSIPLTRSIANMDFGAVRWVLVVEKDVCVVEVLFIE